MGHNFAQKQLDNFELGSGHTPLDSLVNASGLSTIASFLFVDRPLPDSWRQRPSTRCLGSKLYLALKSFGRFGGCSTKAP